MEPKEKKFANTTSSLYIDSTISKPNADAIISSVSTIIHSQIVEVKLKFNFWLFCTFFCPFLAQRHHQTVKLQ
jgi:hypothetical protein